MFSITCFHKSMILMATLTLKTIIIVDLETTILTIVYSFRIIIEEAQMERVR